jgi:hypothetical protein
MLECQYNTRIERSKMILSRTDRVQTEQVYALFSRHPIEQAAFDAQLQRGEDTPAQSAALAAH